MDAPVSTVFGNPRQLLRQLFDAALAAADPARWPDSNRRGRAAG